MEKTITLSEQQNDFIVEVLREEMTRSVSNKEKYIIHDLILKLQS